jgi:hypothetical protein
VQLGHTDGGALVMSTYGHPSEDSARARLLAAYNARPPLRLLRPENTDGDTDGGAAAATVA